MRDANHALQHIRIRQIDESIFHIESRTSDIRSRSISLHIDLRFEGRNLDVPRHHRFTAIAKALPFDNERSDRSDTSLLRIDINSLLLIGVINASGRLVTCSLDQPIEIVQGRCRDSVIRFPIRRRELRFRPHSCDGTCNSRHIDGRSDSVFQADVKQFVRKFRGNIRRYAYRRLHAVIRKI